jgi:hypothetical protein
MATLNEIEERIQFHSNRLNALIDGKNNYKNIQITTNLVNFWKDQKNKALKVENRIKLKS